MCEICADIIKKFPLPNLSHAETYNDYCWAYQTLREKEREGLMEFLAGDCPLEDIEQHLKLEDIYIMCHYFKCGCGNIFFVGFCCRGTPIGKIVDKLPENISYISSGHYGSYYNE